METPLQLDFSGFEASQQVRELIASKMKAIEGRFPRVTSCRIAVHAPDKHHRDGEPFKVSIFMALPDRKEVRVSTESDLKDPRKSSLSFAITDAFRRATKQLETQVDFLTSDVKLVRRAPRKPPAGSQA